ncbi:MAG: rhomboid family intramembrane serine protease [Pirellulaceae bacterium]|nr:rhomboid family intramembrane serine protease [Pirellulaceae bacterium]
MGYQDREYYRDERPPGAVAVSLTVKLIVVNCLLFLANLFVANNGITAVLSLRAGSLVQPQFWYQFLSYGFVHDPKNLMHLIGNMVGLFFFARVIEQRLGWKELLRFYLLAILLGGLVWASRVYFIGGSPQSALFGASGGVVAVVILFCLLYPRATILLFFALPTPAWLAGLLLVAFDMFGVQRDHVAHDVHLTGAALALAYWYFGWNFGRLPGLAGLTRGWQSLTKALKPKPDLRLHDPEQYYEDLDAEADRVLDKLHREGEGSLNARERRILEDYSRRMRQKRR